MKKALFFLLSIIVCIACDPASVDLSNDNYEFDGRGGARCEVNGDEFIPRVTTSPGANSINLAFIQHDGEELLSFSYNNRGPDNKWLSLKIVINEINPIQNDLTGSVFEVNEVNVGSYNDGWNNEYNTNSEYIGELEIVYHDQNENILAGRFWFDAINFENDIKFIRDGEFDLKY